MTELTTAAPWFSIISSQEAFILSKPYISLTSLTTVRFWITLVTDTQRRCEYNRLERSLWFHRLLIGWELSWNNELHGEVLFVKSQQSLSQSRNSPFYKFHYVFTRARHWPLSSATYARPYPPPAPSFLTLYPVWSWVFKTPPTSMFPDQNYIITT